MTSRFVSLLAAAGLCLAGAPAWAAINYSYTGSGLHVSTTAGEDVALSVSGGLVKVNGADPESGGVPFSVPVAGLGYIVVTGDDLPQTLDLSGLTAASGFASGSGFSLKGGGGDDVLIGGGLSTDFEGGSGADSCQGGSTNDSFRIYSGEGPDTVTTLGGSSVLTLEGDDSDETYHLFRDGAALVVNTGVPGSEHLRLTGGIWIMAVALYGGDDTVTTGDLTGFGIENMTLIPEEGKFHLESSSSGIFNQLNMDAQAGDSVISGGNCLLYYTADDAGETATLTASGTAAVLNRISPRPATISLTGVPLISLTGGASDDRMTIGDLAEPAVSFVSYQGRGGANVLSAEDYTGELQTLTGLTAGVTEAHLPLNGLTNCFHWAQDPAGSSLLLEASGATGRIADLGLGVTPLTTTGGGRYKLTMGSGGDSVEVRNLASASVGYLEVGFQAGDDSLILRDLGNQSGFQVKANGETHGSGDGLTLDAGGMPFALDEAGGVFGVGGSSVSFKEFESVTVINAPTPTPSPTPSLTPSPSASPSPSATASLTPSATPSPTASLTPSPSPSPTASLTPSATPSPTASATPSATVSATPSATASPSPSPAPSPSPTPSPSATAVPGPGWVVR